MDPHVHFEVTIGAGLAIATVQTLSAFSKAGAVWAGSPPKWPAVRLVSASFSGVFYWFLRVARRFVVVSVGFCGVLLVSLVSRRFLLISVGFC